MQLSPKLLSSVCQNFIKFQAPLTLTRTSRFRPSLSIRNFATSPVAKTDDVSAKTETEMVEVTFVKADGTKLSTKGKLGDNLLDVVVNNEVDLDGFGACEGTLACSTCHVIFNKEDFAKIKEKLTDEEMDMLDMAFGLSDTSRLGCQVCLTKELAGVQVKVPEGVNDQRS